MKALIENIDGETVLQIKIAKVFTNHHRVLMLSQQLSGDWHLIVGAALIQSLPDLKSIEFRGRQGQYGYLVFTNKIAEGATRDVTFSARIVYERSPDRHLHIEPCTGGHDLLMYVSESLLNGADWPAAIHFTHEVTE